MSQNDSWDVIVVGGGPGGSTLASFVAMQGHRVLLLEKARFPRHQIGESLLPSTIHGICSLLGVSDEIAKQNFPRKHGATFRWGKSQELWSFDFSDLERLEANSAGFAYQVERMKFDKILLDNARRKGVDVREEHTVTAMLSEQGRATGVRYTNASGETCTARARFVVDASGHTSKINEWVGERVYSKFFQNVALYGYFENGKRVPAPREGNILCAAFPEGWFWYIPLSDTLTSVGAVIDKKFSDRLKGDHDEAMRGLIAECPLMKEFLASARRVTEGEYGVLRTRKDYSYTTTRLYKGGAVLIGDAACFIDPVFSSGVHLSTYGALLAARSINTVLRGDLDEERCFQEYETRYRLEYERIYNFLIAFYNVEQDVQGYYWEARKFNQTEERANDAFISLVAGVSSGDFFCSREENVKIMTEHVAKSKHGFTTRSVHTQLDVGDRLREAHAKERAGAPVTAAGLVPSEDHLHWTVGAARPLNEDPQESILRSATGGPGHYALDGSLPSHPRPRRS